MSLGFSNIAFPDNVELDKMADFDQANYHYSNAVTSSAATAVSYANVNPVIGNLSYCSAMARNGNWLSTYEGRNSFSITEGVGGTQTNYTYNNAASLFWRGVVYAPNTNEFVVIGSTIAFVNVDTGANTVIVNPLSSSIGGIYVNGIIYIFPFPINQPFIGQIDTVSRTASSYRSIPSTFNGLAGALDKDGVMVWGTETPDPKLKLYDIPNQVYSTLIAPPNGGYNGWAVLGDGRLWSNGFNQPNCVVYTPASMNNGTPKVDTYSKNGLVTLGQWGMSFTGLDGNGYYVDSRARSQGGGIFSDIFGFDYKTNTYFLTQFKIPAVNTFTNRANQNTMVLPDGRILSPGSIGSNFYYTLQMFEPLNTITQSRQVAGFIPNTSN